MNRLTKAIKTAKHLGLQQTSLFALYKIGLKTGHYQRVLANLPDVDGEFSLRPLIPLPDRDKILPLLSDSGQKALLDEADRIVEEGLYRQFGTEFVPIQLTPSVEGALQDWTAYETGKAKVNTDDIKFVWEPARFGWAVPLTRAYHLIGDAKYANAFWRYFDEFQVENSYCQGPNWQSGQEVAIRLATVLLCAPVFLQNSENAHSQNKKLTHFIVEHANRIPPTILYARAQHNNHLITEALGLLCAGYALPFFPESEKWRKLGKRWLENAFRNQITKTGEYVQYSNNYHRLMLQSAVLATALLRKNDDEWSADVLEKLKLATIWLANEVDPASGRVANYGHNDGAYLFPLANGGYADYRPVVQTASNLLLNQPVFNYGFWDEMGLWFGLTPSAEECLQLESEDKIGDDVSWAKMRGRFYSSRPGHADQNHTDLWWNGEAVTLDPGTYRYNAESPWDNQLMTTAVHNTVLVDGQDQMIRASQFLWLNWSDGRVFKNEDGSLLAYHNGYDSFGVMHKRTVKCIDPFHWVVEEVMIPRLVTDTTEHRFQLHWLLPDWNFDLNEEGLVFGKDNRTVYLQVSCSSEIKADIQICRAGEVIRGKGDCIAQMGWYSPTYSVKEPALSFVYKIKSTLPVRITSDWTFVEK